MESATHLPRLQELSIEGALKFFPPTVAYNSSVLVEVHRVGWSGLYDDSLNHLYWITTHRGVLRRWGRHAVTTDRYTAVAGTIEVALHDGRPDTTSSGRTIVVTLDGADGEGLKIPAGVWHTFRTLSETGILMNSKNPPYNPEQPDKDLLEMPNELIAFTWPD